MQSLFMLKMKILIRLSRYTCWFESSLGTHVRQYVFSHSAHVFLDQTIYNYMYATRWDNVTSNMCNQWRLRSACASMQSDQSLCLALYGQSSNQCIYWETAKTDRAVQMSDTFAFSNKANTGWKVLIFFLFRHENISCKYSLEAPHWGTSNEYPQHMFSWRNKKNIMWIPSLI